jgi:hypothetical protein
VTFEVLAKVTWKCAGPLAVFHALRSQIENRFGPPIARDLDSNGTGAFDAYLLRFPCGLEVALWRFHLGGDVRDGLRTIDPDHEPLGWELYANQNDAAHALLHVGITDARFAEPPTLPANFAVMRADDNGNQVEVTRVTSRCEAECLVAEYEARAHKQTYWVA